MHLERSDTQQALADAVDRLLTKSASPDRVRAAEPRGHDAELWAELAGMGLPTMGVAETGGGSGAHLADLAVAAEATGAHVAPAALVEAMVANRLLAACGQPVGDDEPVTLALHPTRRAHPAANRHRIDADRAWRLVPGAAAARWVVALDGDELVRVVGPGPDASPADLGATPIADVTAGGDAAERTVLATGDQARRHHRRACEEWRALAATWLAGLGRRALDIGLAYATEREQFGRPIGSFQAIAHGFADVATALAGTELLAAKAVWALDTDRADAAMVASMAFSACGEAAQDATGHALHVHGGYGFMEEYDIQILFRRAKAARLILGDPRRELDHVAAQRWAPDGSLRVPTDEATGGESDADEAAGDGGYDFSLPAQVRAFRDEVRSFLATHVTDEVIETAHRTGTIHDRGLHARMAEAGWIQAGWPTEVGGGGRSPLEMNALTEEMYLSGAPVDGLGVASLVAHTLIIDGSEFHTTEIVPRILSGEALCCLGYSEPDAGSDVAACSTRATRDGDGWAIEGQKMFTTLAHEADYVFLLTRTNPDAAKHKGLTMFIVPMDTPGIEITPVHTLGGERTNITYYDGVRVDDRYRVGEVDGGWRVMMTALVFERNSAWYGECVRLLDHAVAWAAATEAPGGGTMLADPLVGERLARAAIGNEIANLLGWKAAWLAARDTLPGVEGTMAKLFTTEHYQAAADDLIDILGPEGLLRHGEVGAAAQGWIEATYRHCQVTTIYGGTSEICRGVIAERGLGLPRSR